MFTGIIKGIGTIQKCEITASGKRLSLQVPRGFPRLRAGSSLAVGGVCVTVVKGRMQVYQVDVVPETIRRTTLGRLRAGDRVNLEPSLKVGDELSGHVVLGHVDGVGKAVEVRSAGKDVMLTVRVRQILVRYLAPKGSVAIDGVSLTIMRIRKTLLTVVLIPYTLHYTTLGNLRAGERVNIEVDILARYLERFRAYGK